jgi:hypothetical protein
MGDFELMGMAFLLDLGLYYLGVAGLIYREGTRAFDYGVFLTERSVPVYHLMRTYNRRLAAISRKRRELGTFGRRNDSQRFMFGGFTFEQNGANGKHLLKALARWGWLEISEGWRTWFAAEERSESVATALPAPMLNR